jgi:hypothetical protein
MSALLIILSSVQIFGWKSSLKADFSDFRWRSVIANLALTEAN